MKVATLERELRQQQETMRAMGENPYHVAAYRVPRVRWCSRMSSLYLCALGLPV